MKKKWTDLSVYSYLARYTKMKQLDVDVSPPSFLWEKAGPCLDKGTNVQSCNWLCRIWWWAHTRPRQILVTSVQRCAAQHRALLDAQILERTSKIGIIQTSFFGLPWQQIGCHGNGSCEVFSVPIPDFPAMFGADRPVSCGGDSGQTNTQIFLHL